MLTEITESYEKLSIAYGIGFLYILKFFSYLTLTLIIFFMIPSAFGISLGFLKLYKGFLTLMFMFAKKPQDIDEDEDQLKHEENATLTFDTPKRFELIDASRFANAAARAIVNDNVLKRFTSEALPNWNFMARTLVSSHEIGTPFIILWFFGSLYRYFIQLPCRLILIGLSTLILSIFVFILNIIPKRMQEVFAHRFNVIFCRLAMCSLGVFAEFHDLHNLPTHGIVVSNHTSPIDVLVLGSINFYRFTGQIQPGFYSYLQRQLSNMGHIFFERRDVADRNSLTECIKKHATDKSLPPVIIFPEGTCINNTSVMQFRKGTFEICDTVYPVAIKYNPMFGDAFWNSSKESYGWYMVNMASSWFVFCDVWFMPPLVKSHNEDAVSFASRVQKKIAKRANIVNLDWDGNLKRTFVPSYLKKNVQMKYAQSIIIDHE